MKKSKIFVILFLNFFILSACNIISPPEPEQPKINISKILARKKRNLKKMKIIKTKKFKKKFVYNPFLIKRDPFEPFIKKQVVKKQIVPENIPLTPLVEYSLSQLKFVGIIKNSKPPLALAETSDYKGLIFSVGDFIGTELYKVVKIENTRIILERKFRIGNKIKKEFKVIKIEISEGE